MARHSVPNIIEQMQWPRRTARRGPSIPGRRASSARCAPRSGRRTSSSSRALIFGRRLLDPAVGPHVRRRVRRLLRAVGRRLSGQRHRRSRGRPPASAEAQPADRVGRGAGFGRGRGGGGARRRWRWPAAFLLRFEFGIVAVAYVGAAGALLGAAEAHRHHRRADDRDRLRAARGGRRGGDRRRDQPLAADRDGAAGAVSRAQQAAARAGAAGRRRHQPPADPRGIQPVPARPDDLGGHGLDARGLRVLHRSARTPCRSSAPTSSA